eukprot:9027469-Pyramimonas_sp.AAC.1
MRAASSRCFHGAESRAGDREPLGNIVADVGPLHSKDGDVFLKSTLVNANGSSSKRSQPSSRNSSSS